MLENPNSYLFRDLFEKYNNTLALFLEMVCTVSNFQYFYQFMCIWDPIYLNVLYVHFLGQC